MGDYLLVDDPDEQEDEYIVRVINFRPNPEKANFVGSWWDGYIQDHYVCELIDTYQKPLKRYYIKNNIKTIIICTEDIVRKLSQEEVAKAGLKPGKPSSIRNAFK
jgi:hypothetical protein